jgi:hypothetical protein
MKVKKFKTYEELRIDGHLKRVQLRIFKSFIRMKNTLTTLGALLTYANAIQITQNQNQARFERWT